MGEGGFCPVLAWRMNVASRMRPGTVVEQMGGGFGITRVSGGCEGLILVVKKEKPPAALGGLVASRQRAGGAGHYCRFLPCVRLRLRCVPLLRSMRHDKNLFFLGEIRVAPAASK